MSGLDVQAFAQYLNHPITEAVQDIFSLFEEVKLVFTKMSSLGRDRIEE